MNEINKVQLEQISGKDYPITIQISAGRNARATWIAPINSRNFLVMQSGVGDTGEAIYISPKTNNSYIQAVSIRQHITKKPSEIVYLNLRKASVIRVMAILPNSRPSTGWRRGYLTNELHKRDFRCRRTKLRYSRIATIKLWWQHLRAQLPGTLPLNPWQEAPRQCSHHKTIGTIPRYPRDPKFFLVKFEKRRVKTLRQDALPERWGDWEVKRIPKLSDI